MQARIGYPQVAGNHRLSLLQMFLKPQVHRFEWSTGIEPVNQSGRQSMVTGYIMDPIPSPSIMYPPPLPFSHLPTLIPRFYTPSPSLFYPLPFSLLSPTTSSPSLIYPPSTRPLPFFHLPPSFQIYPPPLLP